MDERELDFEHIRQVKHRHEAELMRKPNVVGVGIGQQRRAGHPTDEVQLVVNVTRKVPEDELAPEDRIPEWVEDVPVRVYEVGEIAAQARPAEAAASAGRERESRRPWAFWKRWGAGGKLEEGLDLVEDVVDSMLDSDDRTSSAEEE